MNKNNHVIKEDETAVKKDVKGTILRLGKYILKHRWLFVLALLLTLVSNQLSLLGPKFSGEAIDAIASSEGVDFGIVSQNVIKMAICYGLSAILSYLLGLTMLHLSQRVVYTMRRELFEKLTSLPVGYFDTHVTGDIISRISYDIDTVNASLSHDIVQVMTSLYTVIGSLVFMWQISKPLILIFAVTVPVSLIVTKYRSKKVRPLFRLRSKKLGELNGYAEEMLSGGKTIRAYSREDGISNDFKGRNDDTMNAFYNAEYYGSTLGPLVNFINNMSISMVAVFGGILFMYSQSGAVAAGSMFFITLGGVSQFVQYSRKFAGPINEFANIMHEFQSAFSAAERVFRIIDEQPETVDAENAKVLSDVKGNVEFSNINFSYTPDKQILYDISVNVAAGKTVAVVGPTGAGKTTIINLIMRFYDPDTGQIRVDGYENRDFTRESLRKAYTMMLQDTWLFHGTIYENIAYGKEDATKEEVYAAAREANISTYIEGLPDGYDTLLTDNGTNISKGQRQLIAIARAMLSRSSMLILDEATSNVDSRTEIKIKDAMDRLMAGRTCFIIAHRLSTVQNADLILVIQGGRITESGNHDELLKKGGFYSTLYNSQFI